MKPELILGIDPGQTGAWALYMPDNRNTVTVENFPMMGAKNKHLNGAAMMEVLSANPITFAMVELVGIFPKQGALGAFTFGQNYGTLLGLIQALRIPYALVTPAKWKGAMRLTTDKNLSRQRATELFPSQSALFKLVKDDGRAEAALLAVYAAEFHLARAAA